MFILVITYLEDLLAESLQRVVSLKNSRFIVCSV